MTIQPIDLAGGKSVYCFNQHQINDAYEMVYKNPESAEKLQADLTRMETDYSRNERAALAFVLIDRLLKQPAPPNG